MQSQLMSNSQRHEYRFSLRSPGFIRFCLTNVINITVVSICFIAFGPTRSASIGYIFGTSIVMSFLIIDQLAARIEIGPNGLSYTRIFRAINAHWADVESITRWVDLPIIWLSSEGLLLRPRPRYRPLWWLTKVQDRYRRFVPIDEFAPRWRESPVGDDIRRYAPWLIDGSRHISYSERP